MAICAALLGGALAGMLAGPMDTALTVERSAGAWRLALRPAAGAEPAGSAAIVVRAAPDLAAGAPGMARGPPPPAGRPPPHHGGEGGGGGAWAPRQGRSPPGASRESATALRARRPGAAGRSTVMRPASASVSALANSCEPSASLRSWPARISTSTPGGMQAKSS